MDHTRPEGYAFDEYLAGLGENWFDEDALLLRWLAGSRIDDTTLEWLRRFGRTVATRYREWADVVERREKLPVIADRGPYNRPSAEVVLPFETRQMLAELAACKPPCTVGRIAECCPIDMSVVSRHLATLRAAGVVEAHRSGKEVHYELSTSALAKTLRLIADAIETCCPDGTAKDCCGTNT